MNTKDKQNLINKLCQHYNAVVLEVKKTHIKIAMSEPPSAQTLEALRFACHCQVVVEQCSPAQLEHYHQHSPACSEANERKTEIQTESAIELVEQLLLIAIKRRASDIHVEPRSHHTSVRLRIDGVLQVWPYRCDIQHSAIISRLKILADLDITERRIPQDGQFTLQIAGSEVSFRLSTLPTQYGEKAVIRLLRGEHQTIGLSQLGMSSRALKYYSHALSQPQGLILVTGPTGSGKTFTLYSGLDSLNTPAKNICSVEDPIEIPQSGVNQTQINPKAGLDFQLILRALLRQDPDIIMIGEIRDSETATIAVKAAQTGHLVLSTLHTNSTIETITRLRQMGIPGYLLSASLKLVIAQRLVRKLCIHCRYSSEVVSHFPASLWPGTLQTWQATGCENCCAGYYGRLALFECLPVSSKLQTLIASDATPDQLSQLTTKLALSSLYEAGLHAVSRGETTLEEINRVIGCQDG